MDAQGQLSAIIDTDRAFFGNSKYDLSMYKFLPDLEDCHIYIIQYSNSKTSQDLPVRI